LPTLNFNTNRAAKGNTLNKETVENLDIPMNKAKLNQIVSELDKIETERQKSIKQKEKFDKKEQSIIEQYVFNL